MRRIFRDTPDMLNFFARIAGVPYADRTYTQVLATGGVEKEMSGFTASCLPGLDTSDSGRPSARLPERGLRPSFAARRIGRSFLLVGHPAIHARLFRQVCHDRRFSNGDGTSEPKKPVGIFPQVGVFEAAINQPLYPHTIKKVVDKTRV